MEERLSEARVPQQAVNIARAIVNEADRRVLRHERELHPETMATRAIPIRELSEIVTWMMLQYQDTGLWDVESAAAKFDIPAHILWRELETYFSSGLNRRPRG